MKISHIGYAVKEIGTAVAEFEKLGFQAVNEKFVDSKRLVTIQFMKNFEYCIELIAPLSEESPINNILKKLGEAPYHICYETDKIDSKIEELRKDKYILIEPCSEAIAINNCKIAFLYKKNVGLIELVENRQK